MNDLIGRTINGYQIIEQIGQGGMATVFKAYQPSLDRNVAIKILPPIYAQQDDSFKERFKREAHVVAKLRHPNILMVMDFGQDDQFAYIVMDYVEAGTLKDRLKEPITLKEISTVVGQIGEALHYAHTEGVVHRDVKPSNVLLPKPDWALLTDFGLARMVGGSMLTQSGMSVGTPAYMAPEQGSGYEVDARSDVYSLGVMLYEMSTGEVPYTAETPMAVMVKHIVEPLPMPRERNPNLPEAVERIILKAMAKDASDRFQSAKEFVEQLKIAAVEHPTWSTAEIPSPIQVPPAKPSAKKPSGPVTTKVTESSDGETTEVTIEITGLSKWIKRGLIAFALLAVIAVGYFAFPSWFDQAGDRDQPQRSEQEVGPDENMQQALAILAEGREGEATIAFVIALTDDPDQWQVFLPSLEEKHHNPQQTESTLRILNNVVENVPNPPPPALAVLAQWRLESGDAAGAHGLFVQLAESNEVDVWVLIGLAQSSSEMGDRHQALEALDAAHQKAQGDPGALDAIGWTYFNLEEFDLAATAFQLAIDLAPDNPWSYLGLAKSYFHSNTKIDQVPIILGMAVENGGGDPEVHLNVGWVFQDMGDCDQAIAHFEQALALEPAMVEAQEGIDACR